MLIDWFTVGAQALNFVVLVWLMKRFLYKPILDAIDQREKGIATSLADAKSKMAEARHERDEFHRKNEALDQQRQALLAQAAKDADAERQRLIDEARQAAKALAKQGQDALQGQAQRLSQDLARRTQDEVFAIARQALADLASTSLEARAAEVFASRLLAMGSADKQGLAQALSTSKAPALVRSAFDLPGAQRAAIQKAANETFSTDVQLRFETAPELVGGIELSVNGQKLAWSIADYLVSMQRAVDELLLPAPAPATETVPQ